MDYFNRALTQNRLFCSDDSPSYTLSLAGISSQGAKSRVETQIKLELQLFHPLTGEFVKDVYSFLKLPSYTVSKEKFRLSNLKGISQLKMIDFDTRLPEGNDVR